MPDETNSAEPPCYEIRTVSDFLTVPPEDMPGVSRMMTDG